MAARLRTLFVERWFLILLAIVLLVGMLGHDRLAAVAQLRAVRYGIVAGVLFFMALPLEPSSIWRTLQRPGATLLAVVISMGLMPLAAAGVVYWMPGLSLDMAHGVLVAAVTPTTLASAAVWTRRAGGNDSVAILVTLATNLSCFLFTPWWLVMVLGQMPRLAPQEMVAQLGLLVVLPIVAAQAARRAWRPVAQLAERRRIQLGVLCQLGILAMVLLGAIQTGHRLADASGAAPLLAELAIMVAVVLGLHTAVLAAGYVAARGLGMARGDQIAVAFAGSQKTLMIGLQVAMELQVTILPMITYHVGQLVIDTLVADRFRGRRRSEPPRGVSS